MSETLTTAEVAARLGLSRDAVYRIARSPHSPIRPLPVPARRWRWSAAAIERFLRDDDTRSRAR
jgi:excisionase family DNA binding protein